VSLSERLKSDMFEAMKAKDKDRVAVLRMLVSLVKDAAIAKRADVADDEVVKLLMSYAKKREEAQAQMSEAGRDDLAAKEAQELAIVREYLPAPLTEAELTEMVAAVIDELGASSMKDMGKVMKECTARASGRADGSRISAVVKSKLSG
jgi:uncharacterized protein YqeY